MIVAQNPRIPMAESKRQLESKGRIHENRKVQQRTSESTAKELFDLSMSIVRDRPATSIFLAIALGGFAGWFVKQRR